MLFRHSLASGHCHSIRSGSRHPEQTRLDLASHGLSGSKNMEEAKLVAEFPAGFCSLGLISSLREHVGMKWGSVTIEVATKQSMKPPLPRPPVWCLPKEGCFTIPLQPLKTTHLSLQDNKSCNCFRSTTFGVCSGLRCNYRAALLLISFPHTWYFGITQKSAKELNQ